jgi:hypothetical protein
MAGNAITLKLRPMSPERRIATLMLLERAAIRAAFMRQARGRQLFSSSTSDVRSIRNAAVKDTE